jgi:hypothetical protein
MKLIEPDLFAIAWVAQARWLNERTMEAEQAFNRAMMAYLTSIKRKEP